MAAYPHMIFATESAELTKDALADVVRTVLGAVEIELSALKVVATRDGYPFTFWFEDADRVGEMYADFLPEGARRRPVINATTVIDMSGADDPTGEHAFDAGAVVAALAEREGVHAFDEATKRFVGLDYGDAPAPSEAPATPTTFDAPAPFDASSPIAAAASLDAPAEPHAGLSPAAESEDQPAATGSSPSATSSALPASRPADERSRAAGEPDGPVLAEGHETPRASHASGNAPAGPPPCQPTDAEGAAAHERTPPAAATPGGHTAGFESRTAGPVDESSTVENLPFMHGDGSTAPPDASDPAESPAEGRDAVDLTATAEALDRPADQGPSERSAAQGPEQSVPAEPIQPPAPIDAPQPIPMPDDEPEGGFFKRLFGRRR